MSIGIIGAGNLRPGFARLDRHPSAGTESLHGVEDGRDRLHARPGNDVAADGITANAICDHTR
jgi:hypothetical protein